MCSPRQRLRGQLAAEQLGGVDLHHDLGVEAEPGVEVEIAVGLAREAVDAGVGAAAVRVHRPFERHPGGAGHPVDDRAGADLVEGDPAELGGVEGAGGHRVRREEGGAPAGPAPSVRLSQRMARTSGGSLVPRIEHMFPSWVSTPGGQCPGQARSAPASLGQPRALGAVARGSVRAGPPAARSEPAVGRAARRAGTSRAARAAARQSRVSRAKPWV